MCETRMTQIAQLSHQQLYMWGVPIILKCDGAEQNSLEKKGVIIGSLRAHILASDHLELRVLHTKRIPLRG